MIRLLVYDRSRELRVYRLKLKADHRDLGLAGLGVLILVGLAYGHRPKQNPGELSNLPPYRLAYFPNLTHAPALIGVARGDFQSALSGFSMQTRVVNAGPEAMEALLAGEVDFAYVGPSPAVNTYLKSSGKALRIIAGACSGGASLVARDGTSIATIKDLANHRVAIPQLGGTQDVSLRHFMGENGLKPLDLRGSVEIMPLKNSDILTAMKRKQIDAAWVPEPWATRLIQEANCKLVVDERDLWPGRRFTTTVVVVRQEFATRNPLAVRQFLRAHERAVGFIQTHSSEAQKLANDELKRLSGKALKGSVIKMAWGKMTFTTDINSESVKRMARAAAEAGYSKNPNPDLTGLFAGSATVASQ